MVSPEWRHEEFATAKECRARAEQEEELAQMAARDGDKHYATLHRRDAAAWRELARKKEFKATRP